MSKTCAYAAGLFDGEGSVKAHSQVVSGKRYYHARVSVTNTERALLRFLLTEFGGHITKASKRTKKHHKQVWRWEATCRIAVAFLTRVLPYMREPEKIRRAGLVLRLQTVRPAERQTIVDELYASEDVT